MSGQFNWQRFVQTILNAVFPPRCLSCHQFGQWVCETCWQKVELISTPICYHCHKLSVNFKVCQNCQRQSSCQRLIVCGYWCDPLKQFVYGLKYRRVKPVTTALGQLLANTAREVIADQSVVIVPVPLHRWRLGNRGFNQAYELATVVAVQLQQPFFDVLVRKKTTQPQFNLDRRERALNVQGVLNIKSNQVTNIQNKIVLLVDDIVTTGATLNECAKVLKQNGAREVWGLVLAKA